MAVSDFAKARAEIEQREAALKNENALRQQLAQYRRMNLSFLILSFVLVSFGLIMLFSASLSSAYADAGDPLYYVRRQFIFTLAGLLAMLGIGQFLDVRLLNNFSFMLIAYVLTTLLLAAVMFAGTEGEYGAVRWLKLGPITFQPSEFAKISVIYCLSSYFSFVRKMRAGGIWVLSDKVKDQRLEARLMITYPALALGLWLVLIVFQPHLSGAVIVFLLSLSIFFVARISLKIWLSGLLQLLPWFLICVLLLVIAVPLIRDGQSFFDFIGEKFQHVSQRFDTFNKPDEASADQIHQVKQSRYALGSGGLTGKGLGMGLQKSGFLPMVYNDYILSSIGEELGFIGTSAILFLFMAYFLVGAGIALNATGIFAPLLSWGAIFLISLQALLNIAVAAEIIPSTGISLPFFSYGGSANFFFLIAVGMILSVSRCAQREDPVLRQLLKRRGPQVRSDKSKSAAEFK